MTDTTGKAFDEKVAAINKLAESTKTDLLDILQSVGAYQDSYEERGILSDWFEEERGEKYGPDDFSYNPSTDIFTGPHGQLLVVLDSTNDLADRFWEDIDRWFQREIGNLPWMIRDGIDEDTVKEALCSDVEEFALELEIECSKYNDKIIISL